MSTSIKQLTIGLSGSKHDSTVMHLAMRLAKKTQASVDAYLIRPLPDDPQLLLASGFLGETFEHFVAQAEKTIAQFDRTARSSFEIAQKDYPVITARYHNPLKDLAREFATVIWASDMAIMMHPALVNLHYYKTAVLDAIANSGRPLLLLPEDKRIGDFKDALMVWRADTLHAKALASALPMLALADSVTVLSVTDEDYLSPGSELAMRYLQNHGIKVQDLSLPNDGRLTPKLINAICDEREISLLAIGGGLQSDLIDSFVTGIGRRAAHKPTRPILAIG